MSFDENDGYDDIDERRGESMLDDDDADADADADDDDDYDNNDDRVQHGMSPRFDGDMPPNTSFVERPLEVTQKPQPPPPLTSLPEATKEPSAKRGRRGGGGGGVATKRARGGARGGSTSDKLNRLLAKHRQATAREASSVLRSALEMNTDATLPEARAEASVSRQHCVNLLARLAQYEALSGNASSAFTEHARLATRINKAANNMAAADAALFEQCALALTTQSRQIALLRTQVDNLLRGFTDNIAKCDATARFSVARFVGDSMSSSATSAGGGAGDRRQFIEAAAAGLRVEEPSQSASASTASTSTALVVQQGGSNSSSSTGATNDGASGGGGGGLHLRVGPFGASTYSVSTREGVQTVRGAPGASYVMLSLARERGGVQMQAQNEETRHLLKQKRQAVERRRQQQFRALVNPADALLIEAAVASSAAAAATAASSSAPLLTSAAAAAAVPLLTQ